MSDCTMRTPLYAVVGAGFSGIAVAVQLLRRLEGPARVCLINRTHRFGRGMAYGTRSGSHLLNVPAGRMSLAPEDAGEFVRFLQDNGHGYRAGDFVPRKLYGEYLEAALERAQAAARPGVRLELLQTEVDALQEAGDEGGVSLRLADGRLLEASEAILAIGNFAPRPPCGDRATWESPQVANDPWAAEALHRLPGDASVLLAGSGLTAFDVVLSLLDRGHTGPITMMSRRGLLPQPHREQEIAPTSFRMPRDVLDRAAGTRTRLRQVRDLIRDAERHGHDWRDVIGGLRPHTPQLWQQLDARGRRQFVRHVLPYWDTCRHRAAPAIHERIRGALASGQLCLVAARLLEVKADAASDVHVRWRPRGAPDCVEGRFGAVVNCTGPSSDLRLVPDPLIAGLRAQGAVRVDALGLGLEVDSDYRVLRADGQALRCVRYVGPLLRAQFWEATAVPELRVHAASVAERLALAAAEASVT
jgi:uncharacterized NAD(P)/FAD-binding protein YdhS